MTASNDTPTSQTTHHLADRCRSCAGRNIVPFLSLGCTPLANAFLHTPDEFASEARYPLDVYFCETCALVQLLDVVDPAILFRNYIYVTGTSDTMAAHNRAYAHTMVESAALGREDLVIEIASNDGSLLACFRQHGVRVLGIEPARNLAAVSRARGIATLSDFFSETLAPKVRAEYGPARLVVANNVLAHVDDTVGFLAGCRELLAEDGRLVVEAPYLGDMLENLEYDTIYHEHLCYFSIGALLHLYAAAGLAIVNVERVPVHGGSLRVSAMRRQQTGPMHAPEVLAQASAERDAGLHDIARYRRFAHEVARNRQLLRGLLEDLRDQGKSVAAYGAPAKGNTLLNYCGIDTALVSFTVDKNPLKVGLYTPGMHIPVLDPGALLTHAPDYVLILAWNFADEIMRQQQGYRAAGGRFIIPVPEPRII